MTALNQSNKATAVFTGQPTLTGLIDDPTSLRDSVGAPGTAPLTVLQVNDDLGATYRVTECSNPVLIFEWDAS